MSDNGAMRPTASRHARQKPTRARNAGTLALREQLAEVSALLEIATALGSARADDESLDAALCIVMRELRAAAGAFFAKGEDGVLALRASQGFPPGAPPRLAGAVPDALTILEADDEASRDQGLVLLCPIQRREGPVAVLGLGPRADGRPYGARERAFLRRVVACAAVPLENALIHQQVQRLNRTLSVKVFQLHNLFDISRELVGTLDEDALPGRIVTAAMGHFLVSRGALYLLGPAGLTLVHGQGLGAHGEDTPIPEEEARTVLRELLRPTTVSALPESALRQRLQLARLTFAAPLGAGAQAQGVLALGERASGPPFSEEDRDFAQTL